MDSLVRKATIINTYGFIDCSLCLYVLYRFIISKSVFAVKYYNKNFMKRYYCGSISLCKL